MNREQAKLLGAYALGAIGWAHSCQTSAELAHVRDSALDALSSANGAAREAEHAQESSAKARKVADEAADEASKPAQVDRRLVRDGDTVDLNSCQKNYLDGLRCRLSK